MEAVLDDLLNSDSGLDWFYISPAAGFGPWAAGEATGVYRTGDDLLLTAEDGESNMSGADLGKAVVAEIANPAHARRRFTVAY